MTALLVVTMYLLQKLFCMFDCFFILTVNLFRGGQAITTDISKQVQKIKINSQIKA